MDPILHTIPEAASHSRSSRSQLYKEIQAGRLIVTKIGRRTLIADDRLRAWIKTHEVVPDAPAQAAP